MHASEKGSATEDGRRAGVSTELDDLRAMCRRQARSIDALTSAIAALRAGATALRAESTELRADNDRLRRPSGERRNAEAQVAPVEIRLAHDVHTPAAARAAVADALGGAVPAAVVDRARLLVSEMATNSVSHSGAIVGDALVLRVECSHTSVRLEVQDCGRGGSIALRPPDLHGGGGFGLNLVHRLSERWGVEQALAGPTRVWAQLPRLAVDDAA